MLEYNNTNRLWLCRKCGDTELLKQICLSYIQKLNTEDECKKSVVVNSKKPQSKKY